MAFENPVHIIILASVITISQIKIVTSSVDLDFIPQPEFLDSSSELNITSFVGQTARLPCTIKHLGQKTVSWIRGRDLQVLSTGRTTFATDVRVSILPGNRLGKKERNRREVKQLSNSNKITYTTANRTDDNKNYAAANTDDEIISKETEQSSKASIFIHSHGHKKEDPSFKKIIVPYNYLDGIWEPDDYALQIKFAERSDSGKYICQINTEPRMSQPIYLQVVYMVADILGKKELFVKEGSSVALICKVNQGSALPGFIFWFKDKHIIDYEPSNGRIQVKTSSNGRTELVLANANANDTANYTCSPSGGRASSATLTVIADERPAAMQQGNVAGLVVGDSMRHTIVISISSWIYTTIAMRSYDGMPGRIFLFLCASLVLNLCVLFAT